MEVLKQKLIYGKNNPIVSVKDKVLPSNTKIKPLPSVRPKVGTKLILMSFQSPGDTLMMTAAVRDLHRAYPNTFLTDVRTFHPDMWKNNPYITPLSEEDPSVTKIEMGYDLIHKSNQTPYHFIHGFRMNLEKELGMSIPMRIFEKEDVQLFKGDIHLSREEKNRPSQLEEMGIKGDFWIIVSGGKYDLTAKWYNPDYLQEIVDHFCGKITFVQIGEKGHFHPKLNNVIDLREKTDLRQLILLTYHSTGVICPVTLLMHLSAAVETKPGRPKNRAGVILAGGREPTQWEAYPHHRFLSTNGALMCCDDGGCWKDRCTSINDKDDKKRTYCLQPVIIHPKVEYDRTYINGPFRIPKCMDMIKPNDIIRAVESYYDGGALKYNSNKIFVQQVEQKIQKATNKKFSVLVCCYGDYPEYSIRCVSSILNCQNRDNFDLHVGCNACGKETLSYLRKKVDTDEIHSFIDMKTNINKDPMLRLLIEKVKTPYILYLDDDSHMISNDWDNIFNDFIDKNTFDCAGKIYYMGKNQEYKDFVKNRKWFRGEKFYSKEAHKEEACFATGGMFLVKTSILTTHDFPDKDMVKKSDDLLLGDLISQQGYKLIPFSNDIEKIIKISDGDRRGVGEGKDGWIS